MTMRTMGGPGAYNELAAGAYAPWSAGRTYTVPSASGSPAWGTTNYGLNYTWFFPVPVPNACYINTVTMYFYTTTAATGSYALYSDNPKATSAGPTTRLWQSGTVSSLAGSSLVFTTQTAALAVTNPQLLWFSFFFNQTVTSASSVNLASFVPTSKLTNAQLCTAMMSTSAGIGQPADYSSLATLPSAGNSPLVFFGLT